MDVNEDNFEKHILESLEEIEARKVVIKTILEELEKMADEMDE